METEKSEIAEEFLLAGDTIDWGAKKRLASYEKDTRKRTIVEAAVILFQGNLVKREDSEIISRTAWADLEIRIRLNC
ncbi:unnamed protein product [Protopolystoma xenopodis]|uniref:Uncharacterized protein n=1 Tax=Protopolystoma xenopodis TaxID=117903 RepID=A0A3S5BQ15_9PLAT|nr:unnamed protein product [Protopolystoma xenopodis]